MLVSYSYRRRDNLGNFVYGHMMRCYALHQALVKHGFTDVGEPELADLVICDGVKIPETKALVINIIDTLDQRQYGFINISPTFLKRDWLELCGPRYAIIRDGFSDRITTNTVVFVPGGNKEGYWKRIDPNSFLLCQSRGYRFEIAENLSEDKMADLISSAALVICPAGVTSLEAASIGKPLLIVQTSEDQKHNYKGLIDAGCARPFTTELLDTMLEDHKYMNRIGEKGFIVNRDGKHLIANWIHERVLEWNS